MPHKKIEVVELNKPEETIILEEKKSPLVIFLKKHRGLIISILLIIAFLVLITGLFLTMKNLGESLDPTITQIDTNLENLETTDINITGNYSLTEKTAENIFRNSGKFKSEGSVLLVKTVTSGSYEIKYYSDGTALKIMKNGLITRINALEDGRFGIDDSGIINTKATILDVTLKETKKFSWGIVNYYSDGSAEVKNDKIELYVRNSNDITENYISDNKITYLKESKNIGNTKLNYYYDGTIEIIKDNKSYLVRNESDIKITNNNVTFPNNNKAIIVNTIKCNDGKEIVYYSDGGAIIKDGSRTISVRKSNSIVIKNNKIYEIVDSIYVTPVYKKKNTTYYSNGGAITNYQGRTVYVPENSNIKYDKKNNITIKNEYENLTNRTNINGVTVLTFKTVALVETKEYKAIVPKESVIYNSDGSFKGIISISKIDDSNQFTITNNTKEELKYRLVIEKSDRSNLDVEYIRYQLTANEEYIPPSKLNNNIWQDDNLASKLSAKGINYILIESTIAPFDSVDIKLMLWTDYDTIPNEMQDKYFYGTIKVYSWTEK